MDGSGLRRCGQCLPRASQNSILFIFQCQDFDSYVVVSLRDEEC